MKQVLIDTDVLLDCCLKRDPFAKDAIQLLSLCEIGEIQGYTTPLILSNFYYLVRKNNTHQQVMVILKKLTSIIQNIPITTESLMQAIESPFKDFEDALQYQSCLNHGEIQCIITRNKKDFRNSQIAVMSAHEFLAHLIGNAPNNPVAGR